jgi:hypothetical protein
MGLYFYCSAFLLVYPKILLYQLSKLGETMKKMIMTGLVCLSVCMPLQVSAESLLERVVTGVILGVYDKPKYQDDRPYYFYNDRYYYGGELRNGNYYYEGRRLDGGRYYERGYQDQHKRDYGLFDKPRYQDDRPYYFYNNRYYYGGELRNGQYYHDGRRLDGGRYYERGYQDQYREDHKKKYKKEKHPNHKNGYYKHNKHYLGEHQHDYYGEKRYSEDRKKNKKNKKNKSHKKPNKHER